MVSGAQGKGGYSAGPGTLADGQMKVKRTIGWYNRHGGLASPIIYKNAKVALESLDPRTALSILSGLKDKASTIRDPTAWVKKAAARCAPDLDPKVKRTILWYNQHEGLPAQIHYDEVKAPLAALPVSSALKILKGLEGGKVRDPTWWIVGAVQKELERQGAQGAQGPQSAPGAGAAWGTAPSWSTAPAAPAWAAPAASSQASPELTAANAAVGAAAGLDAKVLKTVAWYNRHGQLQQPIDLSGLAPVLASLGTAGVLEVLKGLDGKGPSVKNPTAWLASAVQRKLQA